MTKSVGSCISTDHGSTQLIDIFVTIIVAMSSIAGMLGGINFGEFAKPGNNSENG